MKRLELSPHQASVLATIAQTPDKFDGLHDELTDLLVDDVAKAIAKEIRKPSGKSSPEVRETARGIRRWAESQKPRGSTPLRSRF